MNRPDAQMSPPAAVPPGEPRWRVRLLGGVEASDGVQLIERLPSRAAAALLARVALAPERAHSREELVELLWPGVELAVGRNRLRQTLSTLKSLLEPAGQPGAAVLQADRLAVRVVRGALACDAVDFERQLRGGHAAEAAALYRGELMPGYYDEWIDAERQRLAALHGRLQQAPVAAPAPVPAVVPVPAVAAALPAIGAPPLPTYLTRLFGADMAAARLRALVQTRRLVTLLGPGGSGKTRWGVEVAQALRQPLPAEGPAGAPLPFGRIAFVSLVACDNAAQMLDAMARALQLPGSVAGAATLAQALAGQRVLLVLDNFEQLVGHAETVLAELLSALPALHVLVTSRRALALDGEHAVPAEPLALPSAETALAAAAANPAVALFVDRARAVRADFHLGERNHAAIVALVRALRGMPLAIELAASRVRSFPPAEMVAMLADTAGDGGAHLSLLMRGGPRAGHDPRHASMAQVIEWSWRLLDAGAQALLGALAQFPADAGAAAVAAVVEAGWAATAARLDDLAGHSLVRVGGAPDEAPRFGLVEPVREFVVAQAAVREAAPAQRARLRRWLVGWAQALGPAALPAQVAPELATVHAVLSTAADHAAGADALALALALRHYWDTDGLPGNVLQALEQALHGVPEADADADAALRSDAHELFALLRFESGFVAEARAHAEAALAAAGSDAARRARALVRRAWLDIALHQAEAAVGADLARLRGWLNEALALARACGDREAQARALHQLAMIASQAERDPQRAEALLAQAQALWEALGHRRKAYAVLRNRVQCWVRLGRPHEEALAAYARCEQAAREDGDWVGQIDTLISLSALLSNKRRWRDALLANQRCVTLCWQRWHRHGLAYALWNPPRQLAHLHRPEEAMRLMGFAARFWSEGFGPLGAADRRYLKRVRGLVRAQLGALRTEALWIEGAGLDLAAAVALALTPVPA